MIINDNDYPFVDVAERARQMQWGIMVMLRRTYALSTKDYNVLAPYFLEKRINEEDQDDLFDKESTKDALKYVYLAMTSAIPTSIFFTANALNEDFNELFERAREAYEEDN